MDQVRAIFRIIWQQRFWVLSVIGVIVAAVCWQMASGRLDAEFATNKGQIETQFSAMTNISGKSVHGNPEVNAKEAEEARKIRDKVRALWEAMYNRQRDEVLKWPVALGQDFVDEVEGREFGAPIVKTDWRQRYREYAVEQFPVLVELVKAKKMAESEMSAYSGGGDGGGYGRSVGGYDGGAGAAMMTDALGNPIEMEKYVVQWADQGALRQKLDFVERPTGLQIWVTQEDLWVYETLLQAIADTNEFFGASRPDNAAIKVINNLEVGQFAAAAMGTPGQLLLPAAAATDSYGGSVGAPVGREGGYGGYGAGTEGAAGGGIDAMLLMNRYIGEDGKPLADATTDFSGEYRMLPVRMVFLMQQRAIPRLLVECANAALPIEVQRVRVNPEKSGVGFSVAFGDASGAATGGYSMDGGSSGYGRSGEGGGGVGRPMGRSGEGGGYGGYGRGGEGGGMTDLTGLATTGTANVEVHGIVYIYNPPDPSVLTVPGDEDAATVAAAETDTTEL